MSKILISSEMPYRLGVKVTTKHIGPPIVGRVTGYELGLSWTERYGIKNEPCWEKIYPDWKTKVIVVLMFDKPTKIHTIETIKCYFPELDEYEIHEKCRTQIPLLYAAHPIDDIELFDDSDVHIIPAELYDSHPTVEEIEQYLKDEAKNDAESHKK